jgi:integrase/recombinase XerD
MVELWLRRHRNPNTKQAYAADAKLFRSSVAKPLHQVTVADLEDFADRIAGSAAASQSRCLSAVKSLIAYACQLGYLQLDVGAPIQLPKIKDTLGERIMTEEAVQRLLWSADSKQSRFAQRDAVLMRLLYGAGLRISEACGLRWRDAVARDDAGQITVFGKGGKTRTILLPRSLWRRVDALRGIAGPDHAIFRSRQGNALDRTQVHRIIKSAVSRAKLPSGISAHWFRHAHASHALDRGAPVHVVQTTLGHASLTTTTRYTHVRPGDSSARYLTS